MMPILPAISWYSVFYSSKTSYTSAITISVCVVGSQSGCDGEGYDTISYVPTIERGWTVERSKTKDPKSSDVYPAIWPFPIPRHNHINQTCRCHPDVLTPAQPDRPLHLPTTPAYLHKQRISMEPVDTASIISSITDDPSRLAGIVIASVLFGAAVLWLNKKDGFTENAETATAVEADTPKSNKSEEPSAKDDDKYQAAEGDDGKQLRNVFSVKQKPIVTGKKGSSKQSSSDRPFESSYYFAHNKHSTG